MPAQETQTSSPSDSTTELVNTLYKDGRGDKATPTPGAASAPLDHDSLSTVLKSVIKAEQVLAVNNTRISSKGACIQYIIGPATTLSGPPKGEILDDYYLVSLHVCSSSSSASEMMKGYLESFDNLSSGAPETAVRPLKNGSTPMLGDCTLRTPSSVFWVRGESVFAHVSRRGDGKKSAAATATVKDDDTIIPIAQIIDQHLAGTWAADATKQKKPKPTLETPVPIKAKEGDVFTVKLGNVADTHEIKAGQDMDAHIVVLTENGSKDGQFSFLALQAGKTRVRLRVADAKTLAIAEVEAAVEVS